MVEEVEKILDFASWLTGRGFLLISARNNTMFLPTVEHLLFAFHMFVSGEGEFYLFPPARTKTFRIYPYPKFLPERIIFAAKRKETIYLKEIATTAFGLNFPEDDLTEGERYRQEDVCYLTVSETSLDRVPLLKKTGYIQIRKEVKRIPLFIDGIPASITAVARYTRRREQEKREKKLHIKDGFRRIMSENFPKVLRTLFSLEPAKTAEFEGKGKLYLYDCPFCGEKEGMFVWNSGEKWKFSCPHCKRNGTVLHFIEYKLGFNKLPDKEKKGKLDEVIIDYFLKAQEEKQKEDSQKSHKEQEASADEDIIEGEIVQETSSGGEEESPEKKKAEALKSAELFYKSFTRAFLWEKLRESKNIFTALRLSFNELSNKLSPIAGDEDNVSLSLFLSEFGKTFDITLKNASREKALKRLRFYGKGEKRENTFGFTSIVTSMFRDGKVNLCRAGRVYVKGTLDYILKVEGFPFAGLITFPLKPLPQTTEFHIFSSLKEGLWFALKNASSLNSGERLAVVTLREVNTDDLYATYSKRFISGENLEVLLFFLKVRKSRKKKYRLVVHGKQDTGNLEEIASVLSDRNFYIKVDREP